MAYWTNKTVCAKVQYGAQILFDHKIRYKGVQQIVAKC